MRQHLMRLTLVISAYSYKTLEDTHDSDKRVRMFWAVVFIILPIVINFLRKFNV